MMGGMMKTAIEIMEAGAGHMRDRAELRDSPEGERSMRATVAAFNAIYGKNLTEVEGWVFMALLKAVRSSQGNLSLDDYEDGAAYFALAGEAAQSERGRSMKPCRRGGSDCEIAMRQIANIAHHGGLIGFEDVHKAMREIARLSLPYWDKDECANLQIKDLIRD